uniref:hypothetical protein n=1 Tax=Aeromonas veronii TaxID=654 RepID=UPI003B9FAC3F
VRFTPCPIGFSIYWEERCKPYSGRDILNAKAPLDERGFFMTVRLVFLAGRVSSPTGDGDRHPRPFIIQPDAGLTANGDAFHVFHITAQYLTALLASGMVAGHT